LPSIFNGASPISLALLRSFSTWRSSASREGASMIGPTSVVGLGRVADFQLGEGARGEAASTRGGAAGVDEQDALRRAALAGALEGGGHDVVDHCSGEAPRVRRSSRCLRRFRR